MIKNVSELFKGYRPLILGFNTFLPPGYKIEEVAEEPSADPSGPGMSVRSGGQAPAPGFMQGAPQYGMQGHVQPMQEQRAGVPPRGVMHAGAQGHAAMLPAHAAPMQEHRPLEFDQAINYVTKIKRRFVDEQETYRQFLDILNTYQRHERSIKDVLDRVSVLFRDHPDLLRDFTYFLPDAVQSQAKERLSRAARKNEERIARQQASGRRRGRRDDDSERARRRRRSRHGRDRDDEVSMGLPPSERAFFDRAKAVIGTRDLWVEFLKCLDLYSREIISRAELLTLLVDVVGTDERGAAILDELKTILQSRGSADLTPDDTYYSMPVSEIDFSNCRQCTPSYRALPDNYPNVAVSEASPLERSVLNTTWVSVPTGSEDFSFKSMRKNQYEEALFRCEDERYEVDMVIDNNVSTIRVLEPLVEEINTLRAAPESAEWQFRLDRRSLGVLHLKAIHRVYGEHGAEMLELMRRNPASALPVILKRLKQKDEEWRRVRLELNKGWKEVLEKNYHKSLDHRSFYFKQQDKKRLTSKSLLAEMRALVEKATARSSDGDDAPAAAASSNDGGGAGAGAGGATSSAAADASDGDAVMRFKHEHLDVHKDVAGLISFAVEKNCSSHDKERIASLWSSFIEPFFCFPPEWRFGGDAGFAELREGSAAMTAYGVGIVEAIREPDDAYFAAMGSGDDDQSKSAGAGGDADMGEGSSAARGGAGGDAGTSADARVFVVSLPWGRAVLRASAIQNLFAKVPSKGSASSAAAPRGASGTVKPLTAVRDPTGQSKAAAADEDMEIPAFPTMETLRKPAADGRTVFLGTAPCYVFFRLYQLLFERLSRARQLCAEARGDRNLVAHPTDRHVSEQAEKRALEAAGAASDADMEGGDGEASVGTKAKNPKKETDLYQHFLTAVYGVISGSLDQGKFEDECRNLMGTASYMLFTMERLVNNAVKQFQVVVNDLQVTKMRALWVYQQSLRGGDQDAEVVHSYRSNCAVLLSQRNEDCFAVEYQTSPDGTAELVLRYQGRPAGPPDSATVRPEAHASDAPAVRSIVDSVASSKPKGHAPFLKRTIATGEDAGAGISGGDLEVGLTAKTGRMVYKTGTTDAFIKAGKRGGGSSGDAPMGDA